MKNHSLPPGTSKHNKKQTTKTRPYKTLHDNPKKVGQEGPLVKKQVKSEHMHSSSPNLKVFCYRGNGKSAHLDFIQVKNNKQIRSMLLYQGSPKSKPKTHKEEKKKNSKKRVIKKVYHQAEPSDYIMIGQDFYPANTSTQRQEYTSYLQKFKQATSLQQSVPMKKKSLLSSDNKWKMFHHQSDEKNNHAMDNLKNIKITQSYQGNSFQLKSSKNDNDLNEIIARLSQQQKQKLFSKLQKQLGSTNLANNQFYSAESPCIQKFAENNSSSRLKHEFKILQEELVGRHELELEKMRKEVKQGIMSQNELECKQFMLGNIKRQKIKAIECARQIFEAIIGVKQFGDFLHRSGTRERENWQENQKNSLNYRVNQKDLSKMMGVLEDVKDFSEEQKIIHKRMIIDDRGEKKMKVTPKNSQMLKIGKVQVVKEEQTYSNSINSDKYDQMSNNSSQSQQFKAKDISQEIKTSHLRPQFQIIEPFNHEDYNQSAHDKFEDVSPSQHHNKNSSSDEILLITPSKCEVASLKIVQKGEQIKKEENNMGVENQIIDLKIPLVEKVDNSNNLQNLQLGKDQDIEELESQDEFPKKIKIPLLLTKQKVQQLQMEYQNKVSQKLKIELERKISFQMSEFQYEDQNPDNHFTTLADVNGFIVGLYEFVIRNDLDRVVERLNLPYGKSVRDKLYILQKGYENEEQLQYYTVLDEEHFHAFNNQIISNGISLRESEKIHNHAVFDAFNFHLNAYRPYFQLEGEVYPWQISQKGITFYEISEQNIEEVFEKTKVKILQFCSMLCGVHLRDDEQTILMREKPNGAATNNQFIKEILNQKNEEQLIKEQKSNLVEEYSRWQIQLVDTEARVRLALANRVIEQMLEEFVGQMGQMKEILATSSSI